MVHETSLDHLPNIRLYIAEWNINYSPSTVTSTTYTQFSVEYLTQSLNTFLNRRVGQWRNENTSTSLTSPIYLDDVNCSGNEASILDCQHRPIGQHDCGHSEDVYLSCTQSESVVSNTVSSNFNRIIRI